MMKSRDAIHEEKKLHFKHELQKERESAKESLKRKFALRQILGKSKTIKKLQEDVNRISSCDVNVLITGESGTGKELFARAIHYLSSRSGKPFIPVNCGAIPENLFENELFGHAKGAFTDASFQQIGLVKEAEGGTLFLDEIGTISHYIQIKFLRLLQDREYKPLGDSKLQKADIRIVAATNRILETLLQTNDFREDLFYRLNVVSIDILPLRQRKEDIPVLVKHFVNKYSREYKKPAMELTEEALHILISYSWPGNIRELENKIQKIVVMSTSPLIRAKNIQLPVGESNPKELEIEYFKEAKKKAIKAFEKNYIAKLLTENNGNMISAARNAGKSRTALWNLLKKHNLSPRQFHI